MKNSIKKYMNYSNRLVVAEHDHRDDPKGVWHLRQSADAAQGEILVEEK